MILTDVEIRTNAIYNRNEAGHLLGVSVKTIDRWCERGLMGFGEGDKGKVFKGRHIKERRDQILNSICWMERGR